MRIVLALICLVVLLLGPSSAQVGVTFFPGPGAVHSTGGAGCASTGIANLSNVCNDIYLLTLTL